MHSAAGAGLRMLHLVVTSACNLGCSYCYQRRGDGRAMSREVLDAALDRLVKLADRSPTISFHGGEPLLEQALIRTAVDRLEERRSLGFSPRYCLTTNGTLLDREVAAFLDHHRVRTVISLDGIFEAQELRAPGTFPVVLRALRQLAERHPRFFRDDLAVAVTVTSANLGHLSRSVDLLLGLGVCAIEINPLLTDDPGWGKESRRELVRQLRRVEQSSLDHLGRTGEVPVNLLRRDRRDGKRPLQPRAGCAAPTGGKLAVDVDGRVWACVLLVDSLRGRSQYPMSELATSFDLGRVTDPGLPERLRNLPERIRGRGLWPDPCARTTSRRSCGECTFVEQCQNCPLAGGQLPGTEAPGRVPDHLCDFQSAALECRRRFPDLIDPFDLLRGLLREATAPNTKSRWDR